MLLLESIEAVKMDVFKNVTILLYKIINAKTQ